ncbi:MAG: hypothetical protein RIQ33_1560 [Bacteroidota bacterium]
MKRRIFTSILSVCFSCVAMAQNNSAEVHVAHGKFRSQPQDKAFVESYFSINPQTLSYKKLADSTLSANLIITILFKNEKNEIVNFDKFQVETEHYKNIQAINQEPNFLLNIRRNILANGIYSVETEVKNDALTTSHTSNLNIDFDVAKYQFSDIEILDTFYENNSTSKFSRGDVALMPSVINYLPRYMNQLHFFSELYIPKSALTMGKTLIQYSIQKKETGKILSEFSNSFALENATTIPILSSIDITNLQSGNYELKLMALTKSNEILATKTIEFQRSKPLQAKSFYTSDTSMVSNNDIQKTFVAQFDFETIQKRLTTLYPIASESESNYIDNLLKSKKENNMKMFYYNFWVNRNMQNPIAAYNAYELQLKEVNNAFGLAYKYGFETARGRTYLQYGPPNSINKTTQSADMLPYEIWDYYSLGNQRNIKFVFYAKDRSTNEYELAFTNKRGEVGDPNWMNKIQNTPSSRNFDNNTLLQNTGNTFDRDFNQIIGK